MSLRETKLVKFALEMLSLIGQVILLAVFIGLFLILLVFIRVAFWG